MGKVECLPGTANLQENELQKTLFHGDEERDFRISSRMEILSILRGISMQGTHICIHYGAGRHSVMTRPAGLDEDGMWLDASWFPQEDAPLLLDGSATFVSMYQQVKIQFDTNHLIPSLFRNKKAFFLEWPGSLLRIQRRQFFRSPVPPSGAACCVIPLPPENRDGRTITRATRLVDISGGGVRLQCDGNDTALLPEKTFMDCRLSLPDADPLTVTLEVRSSHNVATGNATHKSVGCRFIGLGSQADILLQRHINRLQGENMAKRRSN